MFDILTFGSATWDFFIKEEDFSFKESQKFITGSEICLSLGSKIDIDELHSCSGGGGTNTAATFSFQGFKVAYCGTTGDDLSGKAIISELNQLGVNTSLVTKTSQRLTNHSFVLALPKKDRTILTYRGASEFFNPREVFAKEVSSKWIYLAPLTGKSSSYFEKIIDFYAKKGTKIAVNPSEFQITNTPFERLKKILTKVEILILNQEEASILTGVPYNKEDQIFKKITSFFPGIFLMTKGKQGLSVLAGNYIYTAGILNSKVIDNTGAGDSFGSGFVSGIFKKDSIEYAIQLGSGNATSCLSKWGAKSGLLRKNQRFEKIPVKKKKR